MSKKKLFSLAVVAIMIAMLSMGSLAWFSDSDSIQNDFLIADSDDTHPDDIFSVDVWEKTPGGNQDQDGYKYTDILPGDELLKEAVVENTGYYDQYVRVTVTVSDASAWMDIANVWDLRNIVKVTETYAADWYCVENPIVHDTESNTIVYTLYCTKILEAGKTVTVFEAVKIPASMTVEQAAAFGNGFDITVKAEAVQTKNLGIDSTADRVSHLAFAAVEGTQPNG